MDPNKDGSFKDGRKQCVRIENVYPHAFWLEKYNKENKFQCVLFKDYLPNTKYEPFAQKFYSKYSEIDTTNEDYQRFLKLIEKSYQNFEPKRNTFPVCHNQEYGWTWKPLRKLDFRDRTRLIKPRCRAELSEFAEKLEEQKNTSRPKFGGLIFKL